MSVNPAIAKRLLVKINNANINIILDISKFFCNYLKKILSHTKKCGETSCRATSKKTSQKLNLIKNDSSLFLLALLNLMRFQAR